MKLGRLEDGEKQAGVGQAGSGAEEQVASCRRRSASSSSNLTDDLRKKYKIKDTVKGVVITGVDANSPPPTSGCPPAT